MGKRLVLIGCNYKAADGSEVRLEPGDAFMDDVPASAEAALIALGAVAAADDVPAPEPTQDTPRRMRSAKEKE